jgi:hypothetical protein
MNGTVFFTSLLLAAANGDAHMTGTTHAFNVPKMVAGIGSHLFRIAIRSAGRPSGRQAQWARLTGKIATGAPDRGAGRMRNRGAVILTGMKA